MCDSYAPNFPSPPSQFSGSTTSVWSQPANIDALLQIPRDLFHHLKPQYSLDWESKSKFPPPVHSPSAERLLRRQVSCAVALTGFMSL